MAAIYDLHLSATGKGFHFNLKAANGEVILSSEHYEQKADALNGIESVRENAPIDAHYEQRSSKRGEPYFVLKAAKGQILGQSEMYSSEAACENGMASVRKNGPFAELRDHTK